MGLCDSISIDSVFQLLRFLGVFPYSRSKGSSISVLSAPLLLWSLFINALTIVYALVYIRYDRVIQGDLTESVQILLIGCRVFALTVNIWRILRSRKNFEEILIELETAYGLNQRYHTLKPVRLELITLLITTGVVAVSFAYKITDGFTIFNDFWLLLYGVITIGYVIILNALVVKFVCILSMYAKLFKASAVAINQVFHRVATVEEPIDCWNQLHESVRKFETYFGCQLLGLITSSVATIVLSMFSGLSWDFTTMIITFPWLLNAAFQVIIVVKSCVGVTDKAAEFTRALTVNAQQSPYLVKNKKVELHLYTNKKIEFTASGFFNIDLPLLTTIVSTCVSYWVILSQLAAKSTQEGVASSETTPLFEGITMREPFA